MSPTRLCSHPSCPNPATYRGRCPTHARQNEHTINRAGQHIYRTKRWQTTRRRYLSDHPMCACGCGQLATDVHHIIDLNNGGNPWAFDNLEQLNHACHSRMTRARQTA